MTAAPGPDHRPDRPVTSPDRLFTRIVRWTVRLTHGLASAGLLGCLVLVGWSVVSRYLLDAPLTWVDDAVAFALVAIVTLSAAEVTRRDEHIAVDLLTSRSGPSGRRITGILSALATILLCLTIIWQGWASAGFARIIGITLGGTLEWPVWPFLLMLSAGAALIALVALDALLRLILDGAPAPHDGEAA